jgi:dTDP-4-dehydrorhamnose reductase
MKKKILIIGANSLFGTTLSIYLKKKFNIIAGVRSFDKINFKNIPHFFYSDLKLKKNWKKIENKILSFKPDYLINCTGITKHNKNKIDLKLINVHFSFFLSKLTIPYKFKLIHLSTDCVFDGKIGDYSEKSIPTEDNSYGKTKAEADKKIVENKNTTILRSSALGHELSGHKNLLDWFIRCDDKKIYGFKNAFFSGPTTLEYAKILTKFLKKKNIQGLYNVGTNRISKLNLLILVNKIYKLDKIIKINKKFNIDRSLNIGKFRRTFKYKPKSWSLLLKEQKIFYEKHFKQ